MNESQYLSKIAALEIEIDYLHGLLDAAGIPYKREAKDIEDLSPDKNILFDPDQGARIMPLEITKQRIRFYRNLFNGRSDVYSLRSGKPGLGNLIALPLQGLALKSGSSAFIDKNWNAYPDQWKCLKSVKRISSEYIDDKIKEWSKEGVLGVLCDDFDVDDNDDSQPRPWEKKQIFFHKEDAPSKVEIIVSNRIYINTKNIGKRMQNAIRRMAAFINSEFYKKSRMGFSTKGIPRIIYCGQDEGGYICIPRALLDSLIEKLNDADISFSLTDDRCEGTPLDVTFKGELYEEQMRAASAILEHDNGVLGATTSFGKTVVGAYMIAQRKTNTLILVHNTEIQKTGLKI